MPGPSTSANKQKERRVRFASGTKDDNSTQSDASGSSTTDHARADQELQDTLYSALQAAQKKIADSGVVHFTEFYADADDTEPMRVDGLPTGQQATFDGDIDKLLDVTGSADNRTAKNELNKKVIHVARESKQEEQEQEQEKEQEQEEEEEEETDDDNDYENIEVRRELLIEDLVAAERAFQEEEEREECEEREMEQKDEKGFGSGFARGFLEPSLKCREGSGAGLGHGTGATKVMGKATRGIERSAKVSGETNQATSRDATPGAAARPLSEKVEQAEAVQEVVVERKPTGRRRRAQARGKAKAGKRVEVDLLDEVEQDMAQLDAHLGMFVVNEDDEDEVGPSTSKFRRGRVANRV